MKITRYLNKAALLALGMVALPAAQGADTDIYFETSSTLGNSPLVMLHLEYTSSLASTVCSDINLCPQADSLKDYLGPRAGEDGKLSLFEMLVGVTKQTLVELDGLQVGIMLSNGDDNADTDGGYIVLGFTELSSYPDSQFADPEHPLPSEFPADSGHAKLFAVLDKLYDPQGNVEHKHQPKQVYFEFFRYLTGQGILTGHSGWTNFGTDNKYNAGDNRDCIDGAGKELVVEYPCPIGYGTEDGDKGLVSLNDRTLPGGTLGVGPDLAIEDGNGSYISPLVEECTKIFVINIIDGFGTQQNGADPYIKDTISNGGMELDVLLDNDGYVQVVGWLHDVDLATGSIGTAPDLEDKQNVTSYFIAKTPSQAELAAAAGGTGTPYTLDEDPAALAAHLRNIFSNIVSVSTTFVSASIPVNAFNRSEVIDNVYIALFQPSETAQPFWVGNVKKLKLDVQTTASGDVLKLVDANGDDAVDLDGRIYRDALTYWTDPYGFDVVDFDPTLPEPGESPFLDGRSVDRGGAGQQIPRFIDPATKQLGVPSFYNYEANARQLYTEPLVQTNGKSDPLTWGPLDFSDANVWIKIWPYLVADQQHWSEAVNPPTGDLLVDQYIVYEDPDPKKTTDDRTYIYPLYELLAHMRGMDGPNIWTKVTHRRWLMGDALHSRPMPINYGARSGYSQTNPDVRILFGSNDGYLRMLRNTDPSTDTLPQSGEESWAFMPLEVLHIQKQLMDNAAGGDPRHPYGVDGPPVIYMVDHNQNGTIDKAYIDPLSGTYYPDDVVWAFFGLRRGGQAYYALDVSDPDSPRMLWKITPDLTGYEEMGYTFSTPVVRMLQWGTDASGAPMPPRPVLIFGGGYDLSKDDYKAGCTNFLDPETNTVTECGGYYDNMGTAVYLVDASNGELIWKATRASTSISPNIKVEPELLDSIASNVAAVDTTGDRLMDRAYVGDTGGNVWRMDFNSTNPSDWTITKLLELGRHMDTPNFPADDRRFFHAPDFVPARDTDSSFDGIVIGSGDRPDPLDLYRTDSADPWIENYMYMYKDRRTVSGNPPTTDPIDHTALLDITDNCLQDGLDGLTTCTDTVGDLDIGWKLRLSFDGEVDGEKSLASPLTVGGVIYFSTYIPTDGLASVSCGPDIGKGRFYAINFQFGSAVFDYNTAAGGDVLVAADRSRELLSPGIPSENVYVNYRELATEDDPTAPEGLYKGSPCIMASDLTCETTNNRAAWRLYWYLEE